MAQRMTGSKTTTHVLLTVLTSQSWILAAQSPANAAAADSQVTSTSTSTANETSAKPSQAGASDHRVQPDSQERMLTLLASNKDGLTEAWALFSEGGWSDVGQVIVLASADRRKLRLIATANNAQDLVGSTQRDLKKQEWQKLEQHLRTAKNLADINETMFDGLIFEFVHAKRDHKGQSKITERVYIKQTGNTPHPEHDALINSFQTLRQTR